MIEEVQTKLEQWFYPAAEKLSQAAGRKWKGRVPILVEDAWNYQQKKINKLKQLMTLTDPAVSTVIVEDTQVEQWTEFIREFPEEG